MKAAIVRADRYEPEFNRTFAEYARYRGFVIDAAVKQHPQGKPTVERQVPYVRENFFQGEEFVSLDDAQARALIWCNTTAGLRIHGTTRQQPRLVFEKAEQSALLCLDETKGPFDTPAWATLKVHPDCHVRFDYALYSVPYRHRGKAVVLRADRRLVRIYVNSELVKTHPRQVQGKRSTDVEDYPSDKGAYAMRDATYQIGQAQARGEHVGAFASRLLSGTYPWAHLRQAQKLLRLADKFGNDKVDAACRRALAFDLINVRRVETIIKLALEAALETRSATKSAQVHQLPLRFMRDGKSFCHHSSPAPHDTQGDN
jgi:hypothetical protein